MTKKEQREARNQALKIEELQRHFDIANRVGVEYFTSLYDTRLALRKVYEDVCNSKRTLEVLMGNDLAFMQLRAVIGEDI